MEVYNDQQPDSLQILTPYAHLLLGYFWNVSGKFVICFFVEADIVEEKALGAMENFRQSWRKAH